MNRSLAACAAIALMAQVIHADVKSDILTLTGNRQVKAVWLRTTWCDQNYSPITSLNGNEAKNTQVMAMSTSEPGEARVLDPAGSHSDKVFVTRKDGNYVVWTDPTAKIAYIRPFDGSAAKRNLNLGAECGILCVQYNAATGEENIYVMSSDSKTVYRIPLKSDYTADMSKKTQIIFASAFEGGTGTVDGAFSVSGDGKMAGCALPWPNTRIVNIETKAVYVRHQGMFGCNSNIASDNSYRFMHFGDDHSLFHMWGPDLSTTWWDIDVSTKLPGFTTGYSDPVTHTDGGNPRFTSNAQFMTYGYPGPEVDQTDGAFNREGGNQYGWTAAKVKQCDPARFGHVLLGKFSTDYKSITWTRVAGGDIRNDEGSGMAWVAQDPGPGTHTDMRERRARSKTLELPVTMQGSLIEAAFAPGMTGVVSVVTTEGRIIAHASGNGRAVCDLGGVRGGACIVRITTNGSVYPKRVIVSR